MLLGFLFEFLFGLRVSRVVYIAYYIIRYCWWSIFLHIGGDGCNNLVLERVPSRDGDQGIRFSMFSKNIYNKNNNNKGIWKIFLESSCPVIINSIVFFFMT